MELLPYDSNNLTFLVFGLIAIATLVTVIFAPIILTQTAEATTARSPSMGVKCDNTNINVN
jgi:hypothetical protein